MNTEARSSIDNLLSTLRESLAQPGKSLLPLLVSMSRFAKYSLANQMLIFAQRPDATCVQGYRAWNKAGYQVRKGEHGIAIYAPMLFANKRDNAADSDTDAAPRLGYRVAYVFDITQVDAIAGPGPPVAPHRPSRQHPPTPAPTTTSRRSRPSSSVTTSSSSTKLCSPACSATLTAAASPAAPVRLRTSSSPRSPTKRRPCCCTSPPIAQPAPI